MPTGELTDSGVGSHRVELADDKDFEEEARGKSTGPASPWERILSERTPLSEEERRAKEGVKVDTDWIPSPNLLSRWARKLLGRPSARRRRFGCSDSSHKKAVLLGEVLLGPG